MSVATAIGLGFGGVFVGIIIGMVLSYIISWMTSNIGIGFTSTPNINLNDPRLKEFVYAYSEDKEYPSNQDAEKAFANILDNCKKVNIFFGDTKVKKLNDRVKRNDLIAVTTQLTGGMYATSYERVSTLHEMEDHFEMCLSACAENIIDGYYSIIVKKDKKTVTISYQKVQSLIPVIMKFMISQQDYDNMNNLSAKMTVQGLFKISSPESIQ